MLAEAENALEVAKVRLAELSEALKRLTPLTIQEASYA